MSGGELFRRARVYHLAALSTLALQLASIYILARLLHPGEYDVWLLGLATYGLVFFASQPGAQAWLVRALKAERTARKRLRLSMAAARLLILHAAIVLIVLSLWRVLGGGPVQRVAWFLAAAGLLDVGRQILWAEALAAGRHHVVAALELGIEVLRIAGAVIGARCVPSAWGAAVGYLCMSAVIALPALAPLFFRLGVHRAEGFLTVLRAGYLLALGKNLTALGREVLPVFLLGMAPGVGHVAVYRTTFRLVELPCRFLAGIFRVLLAQPSGALGIRNGWWIGIRCGGMVMLVGTALAAAAPPLVGWLLGREVAVALDLGLILAAGNFFLGLGVALDVIYLDRDELARQAGRTLMIFALAAMVGVLLVPRWGAVGAALLCTGFTAGTLWHWWRLRATWRSTSR